MTKQIESVAKLLAAEMSAISNNFHNTNFNIGKKHWKLLSGRLYRWESHQTSLIFKQENSQWVKDKAGTDQTWARGDHFHYACLPVKRLGMKDLMSPERVDLDSIGKQSGGGDYWGNRNKEQVRARPITAEYQTGPHFKTEQLVAAKLCNRKNQNRSFQVLSETISQTECFFPTDWDRQQLSRSRKTFKWWRHHLQQPASHVHDILPQLFPIWSSG